MVLIRKTKSAAYGLLKFFLVNLRLTSYGQRQFKEAC
jgi:hypothetical protein